jgi:hypothetical protein
MLRATFTARACRPARRTRTPRSKTSCLTFSVARCPTDSRCGKCVRLSPGILQNHTVVGVLICTSMHSFHAWIVSDLIDKYRDGCAIIYRFHHCMADGISMLKILRTALEPVDASSSATKATPVVTGPSAHANASSKSPASSSATADAATKSSSGTSAIKRTRTGLCERVSIFFGAFSKLLLLAADPITALRSATCLPSFGSRKARWLEPYIEVRSSCNFVMPCMLRALASADFHLLASGFVRFVTYIVLCLRS